MSSPMVRTAPLLRALLVCAGLVQVAAALERNGRPGSPFAPAGAAGARNLLGPAAHAVGCHLPPLLGLRRIATPVELDWEGGEVRVAGESARVFGSIPRLSFRNANTESGATFPGRGDTDLDDWFPRANDDPLDADLTLVAMPLAGPLLGISNVRVRGEYGNDFDNNRRIGGQLLATGRGWVGLDTAWNYREVDLPAGKENEFWSGDANVVARLPEVMMLNMRAGAGVNWLHDRGQTDLGYNLTYAADVFLKQPWLLSSEVDWGQVGGEDLFHGRITLGLVLGTMEVFGGYDYYDVGPMELDGLVGGVGLWF